jgi:glycosyltransferase involved in cell wall biosynthesis
MFSLVTACMNRDTHLKASLQKWIALPQLSEIVIVDWSNRDPLIGLCQIDPRIRVIRIENEPRWILSYAYNIGITRATQPQILKCDSDCQPHPDIFDSAPGPNHFFAGYWKSGAACGKSSVNGQCIFSKAHFDAINGYSEYIRTYGRDDEDFYDRLIAARIERREISPAMLSFIDHSEESRVSNQFGFKPAATLEESILRSTSYNEMYNYYLAKQLPWGSARQRATFTPIETVERWEVLRRDQSAELTIPDQAAKAARLFSLRYLTRVTLKLSEADQQRLDEKACLALLTNRMKTRPAPNR